MKGRLLVLVFVLAILGAVAWGTRRLIKVAADPTVAQEVPTTRVKKGRVVISVAARGELQGWEPDRKAARPGLHALRVLLREPYRGGLQPLRLTVLCLAPHEGLGVRDHLLREKHLTEINRFRNE